MLFSESAHEKLLVDATRAARDTGASAAEVDEALAQYRSMNAAHLLSTPPRASVAHLFSVFDAVIRPSFLIRNGDFDAAASPTWRDAVALPGRQALRTVIKRVGQLRLSGVPIGTGFLIRPGTLLTNAHVADHFVTVSGLKQPSSVVLVDFLGERDVTPGSGAQLTRIIHIDATADLALFECQHGPDVEGSMDLSTAAANTMIAVIGFPSRERVFTEAIRKRHQLVFGGLYHVKRLSPGVIVSSTTTRIEHDCSTTGGNSGSPVVDLQTGRLVGVHMSGGVQTNAAIPLDFVNQILTHS